MRDNITTLLLAPVLASLAIATVRPADACGPYVRQPEVFRLSSHHVGLTQGRSETLTFALVDAAANTDKLVWDRLAPDTYDYARMAKAADLATAMEVTLIGPSGSRVISSKKRAILDHTFESRKPMTALALTVPKGQWTFALAGRHEDAAWIGLDHETGASAADLAWLKARNIEPLEPQYVHVGKLGTDLETVSVLSKDAGMISFIRSAGSVIAQFDGSVVGAVTIKGERFVLASTADGVSTIWI